MSSKRIEWVDIAKGAGMLLVILGHALPYGGVLCNLIFAFHMPLFFILSGMVYKDIPMKDMIVKRSRSLLVPYALFCLLGTLITLIMGEFSVKGFLLDMYFGNPEHLYVSSVWFLVAMFGVIILFALIRKIKKRYVQYGMTAVCMGLGFVFGFLFNHGFISQRLPLDLDVVPMAAAFFAGGFYLKPVLANVTEKVKKASWIVSSAVLFGVTAVFVIIVLLNHSVNLHGITYHNPVFYTMESITGSLVLIFICGKLEGTIIAKPLVWIGRNTIYLLGAQAIGIRLSVAAINRIFGKTFSLYGLTYPYAVLAFITTTGFALLFTITMKAVWNPARWKGAKSN